MSVKHVFWEVFHVRMKFDNRWTHLQLLINLGVKLLRLRFFRSFW